MSAGAVRAVVVSHADDAAFRTGLRDFFAYRDLGIRDVSGGRVGAHVIRAIPGTAVQSDWHSHDLAFQMVYVLKGWARFAYEGSGEVLLKEGSMVHQPPGIRHRVVACSEDVELLEITLPAEFPTAQETAP